MTIIDEPMTPPLMPALINILRHYNSGPISQTPDGFLAAHLLLVLKTWNQPAFERAINNRVTWDERLSTP